MQPRADRPAASDRPVKAGEAAKALPPISSRRALRRRTLTAALAPFSIVAVDAWRARHPHCPLIVHGMLDESAHLLTALVVTESVFSQRSRAFRAAVLVASVLIDFDHIPAYTGHRWLDRGAPRPYPHSLTTLAAIGALARSRSANSDIALGLFTGTALHLWRDLSEPGTGVPLLWPSTRRSFNIGYCNYSAALLALGLGAAIVRRASQAPAPNSPLYVFPEAHLEI